MEGGREEARHAGRNEGKKAVDQSLVPKFRRKYFCVVIELQLSFKLKVGWASSSQIET